MGHTTTFSEIVTFSIVSVSYDLCSLFVFGWLLNPFLNVCFVIFLWNTVTFHLSICKTWMSFFQVLTLCLSMCNCLKLGSNSSLLGSKLTGDCRLPLLHKDHSGLIKPQNAGPGTKGSANVLFNTSEAVLPENSNTDLVKDGIFAEFSPLQRMILCGRPHKYWL